MRIRSRWVVALVLLGTMLAVGACSQNKTPIRIGVLHSLTGAMAASESPVADAVKFAVDDLNAHGGVLKRPVDADVADGQSNNKTFALEAEKLSGQDHVSAIFGCFTSASRKSVIPIVERNKNLLFYPSEYEGLETSPNVVYLGAAPNQLIIPAVKWCMDHIGKRMFLLGSDYVFSRTANAIAKAQLDGIGGTVVGEEYLMPDSQDVQHAIDSIAAAHPDVILSTINEDSNAAFFDALKKVGITADKTPVMSFTLGEIELQQIHDLSAVAGDYSAENYFQIVDNPINKDFVQRFRARFGENRVVCDAMIEAWAGVHLWAQAVEDAGTENPVEVKKHLGDQSCSSPMGVVYIDSATHLTWKVVRIAQITPDGQFALRWRTEGTVRPDPYPKFRTIAEWDTFLNGLQAGWGGEWANPGTGKP